MNRTVGSRVLTDTAAGNIMFDMKKNAAPGTGK